MNDAAEISKLPAHERAAVLDWAQRELAKQDLITFCQWIDPLAADRYGARHLRRIAMELERLEAGEIARLFITTPATPLEVVAGV